MTSFFLQARVDYMEDFFHHEVALRGTPLECSLFAVFDGHRGENTGQFCVENLPRMIVEGIRRSDCPNFPIVIQFLFTAQNNLSVIQSVSHTHAHTHTHNQFLLKHTWPHLECALPRHFWHLTPPLSAVPSASTHQRIQRGAARTGGARGGQGGDGRLKIYQA
jgi:hypothetical protein